MDRIAKGPEDVKKSVRVFYPIIVFSDDSLAPSNVVQFPGVPSGGAVTGQQRDVTKLISNGVGGHRTLVDLTPSPEPSASKTKAA
jgi:hypothetical protein